MFSSINVKVEPSNIRNFYSSYIEALEHLFWECRFVQILWNELTKLFQRNKINVKLHLKEICLGSFQNGVNDYVINFVLLLMKRFIFDTKNKNSLPNFQNFILFLNNRIFLEKEAALARDQLKLYEEKWGNFVVWRPSLTFFHKLQRDWIIARKYLLLFSFAFVIFPPITHSVILSWLLSCLHICFVCIEEIKLQKRKKIVVWERVNWEHSLSYSSKIFNIWK